jgi:hypothetical protein
MVALTQLITIDEVFGEKMIFSKYIYFNSKIGLQIKIGAIRPWKLETRFNKSLKPSIKIYKPKLSENRLVAIETTFNQTKDLMWS